MTATVQQTLTVSCVILTMGNRPAEVTRAVDSVLAQHGTQAGSRGPPIRYEAVAECLEKVAEKAVELQASLHMPRIGCGLAGGTWDKIEPLLVETLAQADVPVTVYDFE